VRPDAAFHGAAVPVLRQRQLVDEELTPGSATTAPTGPVDPGDWLGRNARVSWLVG
jgi:hypothetical protein